MPELRTHLAHLIRNQCLNTPPLKNQILIFGFAAAFITAIKWLLANRLELYSDEIFYWQASRFPALAYSDLPFMTAMLAGAGSSLFGNSPFAVRSLFLVLSLSIPGLLYWLALPLHGRHRATQSAMLSLCIPMLAMMGLLAVPDVAIIVFGLIFIACLERATRLQHSGYWIATGVSAALGLSTHYRFSLYLLAALAFMTFSRRHWHLWRSPWLWSGAIIAASGLYPALSFNLVNELSGLDYHLVERHPWQFQAEGLLHAFMQATVVTPLMYAALLYTLWQLCKQARTGNDRAMLFALFAGCNLGVYLILAPWADTTRTTLHWPISGYLPLLVYAPQILSELKSRLAGKFSPTLAQKLILAIPLSGFIGTLLLLAGIGSQGFNQTLQSVVGQGVLSNKMAGWQRTTDHVQELLTKNGLSDRTLIVSDNYYTAAQISFAYGSGRVYTTDTNKIVRDGRDTQYRIWGKDISGLREQWSADALFITEDSTLDVIEKTAVMQTACELFSGISLLDQLFLYEGEKVFSFYLATGLRPTDMAGSAPNCPMPSLSWLDAPMRNAEMSGIYTVTGWAINDAGISTIKILLNGREMARTSRTINRPDVVELQNAARDPQAPVLGFTVDLDTRTVRNGRYQLSLEIVSGHGERQLAGARTVIIKN
jgi:hypothetical protein